MWEFLRSNWQNVGCGISIIALAVWTFMKERKEWLAKKRGLARNPVRCDKAIERIGKLEGQVTAIERDIGLIRNDVKQIRDLHIKA